MSEPIINSWLIDKPCDPLKQKFKKCVLKFYPKEIKDNYDNALKKLEEVKSFPGITYFKSYNDYCPKLNHIHFNIILKSTQYKKLMEKYKMKGPDKDVTCHLHVEDIWSTDSFIEWVEYCTFRERTNWYHYVNALMPREPNIVFDSDPEET